jgi:hypothetical protein
VREWIGVRLVMLSLMAELIASKCFQEFSPASYPRTLQAKGFSIFNAFQLCGFSEVVLELRSRTLKTIYSKLFRRGSSKSLGNEGTN